MNVYKSDNVIESPVISVILSVYNGAEFLADSIESILSQTFRDLELIIINDGSNDSSLNICMMYLSKDNRVILIDKENTGLTKSLNLGVTYARGDYIARQDADDISINNRLEVEYEAISTGNYDLVTSRAYLNNKRVVPHSAMVNSNCTSILLLGNLFIHGTFLGKSELFKEIRYDASYKYAQDYKFVLDCISKMKKIALIKQPLYVLNHHENNISSTKGEHQKYYVEKALKSKGNNILLCKIIMRTNNRLIKAVLKYIAGFVLCIGKKTRIDILY